MKTTEKKRLRRDRDKTTETTKITVVVDKNLYEQFREDIIKVKGSNMTAEIEKMMLRILKRAEKKKEEALEPKVS